MRGRSGASGDAVPGWGGLLAAHAAPGRMQQTDPGAPALLLETRRAARRAPLLPASQCDGAADAEGRATERARPGRAAGRQAPPVEMVASSVSRAYRVPVWRRAPSQRSAACICPCPRRSPQPASRSSPRCTLCAAGIALAVCSRRPAGPA